MQSYPSASAYVQINNPINPVQLHRPEAARRAGKWFVENFPGKVLYALKANNTKSIIDTLVATGITDFDVSCLPELEQLNTYKSVQCHLMHPIKSRETISRAYHMYGVRHFALDSFSELNKICEVLGPVGDLELSVRLPMTGKGSQISLGNKFGVKLEETNDLLSATRANCRVLGITFHVGSQLMEPEQFVQAMLDATLVVEQSGVQIDRLDLGGGFPSVYQDMQPPPLERYMEIINYCINELEWVRNCRLLCEPGRALVAESGSLLVRVLARRGSDLYINDGAFGSLYDAGHCGFRYPVRLIANPVRELGKLDEFAFYGPTCDSADFMPGPFLLPDCVSEGDYLEIGQLGAYGRVLASQFNGGGRYEEAIVMDRPMMTMYETEYRTEDRSARRTLPTASGILVSSRAECRKGDAALPHQTF